MTAYRKERTIPRFCRGCCLEFFSSSEIAGIYMSSHLGVISIAASAAASSLTLHEHVIGFVDLLKLFFGQIIDIRIVSVGMILLYKFLVGFFYFFFGSSFGYSRTSYGFICLSFLIHGYDLLGLPVHSQVDHILYYTFIFLNIK